MLSAQVSLARLSMNTKQPNVKLDDCLLSGVAEERNSAAVSINWPEQFLVSSYLTIVTGERIAIQSLLQQHFFSG